MLEKKRMFVLEKNSLCCLQNDDHHTSAGAIERKSNFVVDVCEYWINIGEWHDDRVVVPDFVCVVTQRRRFAV